MPRARHRGIQSSKKSSVKPVSHEAKIRALNKRGVHPDPSNKREVSRDYKKYIKERVSPRMERSADKATRAEFKKHGFRTTDKGIVVDGPRDGKRQPIKGARVKILKGGVVETSVKSRRDYVYGMTAKEKKEFAKDPKGTEQRIFERLRKRFPNLRKRKVQRRLQWGSYQGVRDFAPGYFMRFGSGQYLNKLSPDQKKRGDKEKYIDKLTGFHYVVHVRKQVQKARKKHGRKRKWKRRRS